MIGLKNGKRYELSLEQEKEILEMQNDERKKMHEVALKNIYPPYWEMMEELAKYFENPLSDSNPFMEKFRAVQREIKAEQERYMNP